MPAQNSTSITAPDLLVCNKTSTSDALIPASNGYQKFKGDMDLITGISVTGTPFMTSLSSQNMDQVYAKAGYQN